MTDFVEFPAHSSYVLGLTFTGDSQILVSTGMDNVVKLWSVPDWRLVRTFQGHENSVNSFSLSPDETRLATGSSDNRVRLWSFPDGELLNTLQDRKKTVSSVQISPDGRWVAAGSYGGRAAVWTLDGELVVGIKASQKNLSAVAFSPDAMVLATSGLGPAIALWSLPTGEQITTLPTDDVAVGSLTFIDAGRRYLVSLGYEGTIRFWDAEDWEEARTIQPDDRIRGLRFSPDRRTIALSMESKVQLRSVEDWDLKQELPVSTKVVNGMAFSPNGRWFAAGAADAKVRVWEQP